MSETSIPALLSHLPASTVTVPKINPTNGKKIFDLPQNSAAQVAEAAIRLREAQVEWSEWSTRERAEILLTLVDLLLENQDKMLDILQLETGKARGHAYEEFAGAVGASRYYGKVSPRMLARKRTRAGIPVVTKSWVEHPAIGLVGVITPWNYPVALTMLDVLPALAAGNTVLQKADNATPLSVLYCRHLAVEAGLPANAWQIVVGDGAEVGNAVTDAVDYVAFTGSTATGRRVAERASSRLIGYSLELGGKNPMIVLPGANPRKAAKIAIGGAFSSAGQLCVSIERVYVQRDDIANLEAALKAETEALKVGKSGAFDMDMGTLTGAAQLERVSGFVEDALAKGAKLVAGGKRLDAEGPFFYAPTVITEITEAMNLDRTEVFGPIIQLYPYDDLDEAIDEANDTEFGLNASIVGNEKEALRIASRLQAGSVNINDGFRASFASMASPMGGMKHSGKGRRNAEGGLLRFTETRTIGTSVSWFKLPSKASEYGRLAPLMNLLNKVLKRLPN